MSSRIDSLKIGYSKVRVRLASLRSTRPIRLRVCPVPSRRTLTSAILASVRSDLPALRHPWLRWSDTPARWHGANPSLRLTQRPQAAPRASASRRAADRCLVEPPRRRSPAAATVARRGDRPPGWSHLGCDHAGPSLRGPWMALAFAPAHPCGPASAYARLAWRASHRPAGRTLAATTPGQACGGHGWPRRREVSAESAAAR
jgi:hypothetical protein